MLIQTYREPTNWKLGKALSPYQVIDKEEAHKQRLLHLSAHLLIWDSQGKICVRKRGDHEERYTSLWTTALGTHVPIGKDYVETIRELLPIPLDLKWVGEFRVKDPYENEVNSLYTTVSTPEKLGDSFMKGRSFSTLDEIVKEIMMNQTTPHLKKAIKTLMRS
ncbi:MAG: hypothetical protein Q8R18_04955 [bacterium]|nr:hypothetical protein [bacterium]